MKIAVLGTGYVGLVTAAGLSEFGHSVVGADKVAAKIEAIRRGRIPIYEPGLDELLESNLRKGTLSFSTDLAATVQAADVIFVCVGTPQGDDGSADMSQIEEVSRLIAENLNGYKVVVEKSTVPVKTSVRIKRTISLYNKTGAEFDVASNPEFLREGAAVPDFLEPDRIIIGVETDRARDLMFRIYDRFKDRILVTNIDTAELIKHASNSFLSMKISYINLMANLCERTEADVELVAKGMGLDPRIGPRFLKAGIGFGGSCFPKDIRALIRIGDDLGVDMSLLKETERVNQGRARIFIDKLKSALWILKDKKVGVLGLAFKPETDDVRAAPSIRIIQALLDEGACVRLHDPKAGDNMREFFPEDGVRTVYCSSPYQAAEGANALLCCTEWKEYAELDLARIRDLMVNPILVDGRNMFDPAAVSAQGLEYFSIGRR